MATYMYVAARSPSMLAFATSMVSPACRHSSDVTRWRPGQVANHNIVLMVHQILAWKHYMYTVAFENSLLTFLILQGQNDEKFGSTFVVCVSLEAFILLFLLFHSISSLFTSRVEDWVEQETMANESKDLLTAENLTKALLSPTHKIQWAKRLTSGSAVVGLVAFLIKLGGYPTAFSYARGVISLLTDRHSRRSAMVITKTMAKSYKVFFQVIFFFFCSFGGIDYASILLA